MSFPTDLDIARAAHPKPMPEVAAKMGIGEHLLRPYGTELAKISLDAIDELADRPRAKYVVVTAITPTPLGEGKTTTSVGLGQAMSHVGKNAVLSLRQPSMGPTFGIKGGAACPAAFTSITISPGPATGSAASSQTSSETGSNFLQIIAFINPPSV
jgi:formate--tetrahydrofolate ligase